MNNQIIFKRWMIVETLVRANVFKVVARFVKVVVKMPVQDAKVGYLCFKRRLVIYGTFI